MFLKELTELSGVSGCEYEVRNFIKGKLNEIGCYYRIDKLGNIIAHNKGKKNDKKIVMSAHMDEVGIIIHTIDDEGFIRFKVVGDLDPLVLTSKIVHVGRNKIIGAIGSNPIHLMKMEDRGKVLDVDNLYIDIGVKNMEEAEKYIKIGDYATVRSEFTCFGNNKIKGKALGGRAGCCTVLQLLSMRLDVDFYGVFTVLREVGHRGAQTAAFALEPDLTVVLDETECADIPDMEEYNKYTYLSEGVAIPFADSGNVYDIELTKKYMKLARDKGISYQIKQTILGTNDADAYSSTKNGTKVLALLLPCRNTNSPVSTADKRDYNSMLEYARMILEN